MTYYVFTGDAYGDETLHSFDEALAILQRCCTTPVDSLSNLKKGLIRSIIVPEGKFTVHKFTSRTSLTRGRTPFSKN